jgi:hypothetical protein
MILMIILNKITLKTFVSNKPILFGILAAAFFVDVAAALISMKLGASEDITSLVAVSVESLYAAWLVWILGWWKEAGLTVTTKDNHLLWILLLMAMMPILLFGTIKTPASFIITYGIILLLTGVGEEILNRGVILRALRPFTVAPQRVHPIE